MLAAGNLPNVGNGRIWHLDEERFGSLSASILATVRFKTYSHSRRRRPCRRQRASGASGASRPCRQFPGPMYGQPSPAQTAAGEATPTMYRPMARKSASSCMVGLLSFSYMYAYCMDEGAPDAASFFGVAMASGRSGDIESQGRGQVKSLIQQDTFDLTTGGRRIHIPQWRRGSGDSVGVGVDAAGDSPSSACCLPAALGGGENAA